MLSFLQYKPQFPFIILSETSAPFRGMKAAAGIVSRSVSKTHVFLHEDGN